MLRSKLSALRVTDSLLALLSFPAFPASSTMTEAGAAVPKAAEPAPPTATAADPPQHPAAVGEEPAQEPPEASTRRGEAGVAPARADAEADLDEDYATASGEDEPLAAPGGDWRACGS